MCSYVLTVQMRKLRHREVKNLQKLTVGCQTIGQWLSNFEFLNLNFFGFSNF